MNEKSNVILLLIARFEFGGIPIQAFLWSRYLKNNGFYPIILAQYLHDYRYLDFLEKNEIEVGYINSPDFQGSKLNSFKYFIDLVKCLNSFQPSYIFSFNKHLSYHVNLIWRFTSAKKSFFMERNHGIDSKISLADSFLKYLSQLNSSGLIYNSYTASLTTSFPRKSFVIKNSYRHINPDSSIVQDFIPFSPSDKVFLHIANLVAQKNYSLLIEGWKLLMIQNPNFKLVVIGSDIKNEYQELIQSFEDLGILYLGKVSDIAPYIQRADICLLSTHHEGCPNVILEYMDGEKLIAASDIPSIREVLDETNHPFLFDNQSPEDFAEKIISLYQLSENQMHRLIQKNKEKLGIDYSEANYEQILTLLNE